MRPDDGPVSRLLISLANLSFELTSSDRDRPLQLPPEYAPFLQQSGTLAPCARYTIGSSSLSNLSPIRSDPLWSCPTWQMGETDGNQLAMELHSVHRKTWIPVANMNPDFSEGHIATLAGRHAEPSDFALNYPYDQAILMNRMALLGAGVLHASGVEDYGSGFIFAGHSGAGKTTIARLWRSAGATLLNDDRIIVRAERSGAVLASSPWRGEERDLTARCVPLKAIFHLHQAKKNRLSPIHGAEALARLLANAVAPFYLPAAMDRLVSSWLAVSETVPSYELDFTPDATVVDLCRTAQPAAG